MQPDYDCVVVGAGLVGATQALALSRLGLKVLCIDARQAPVAIPGVDVRGLALAPSSRALFENLGLWPTLATHCMPIRDVHISEQGGFGVTHLRASDIGAEAIGYVCPADQLLNVLERALATECDVAWRQSLSAIEGRKEHVVVNTITPNSRPSISTRLVVGADGLESKVGDLLGIAKRTTDYQQCAIVANVTVDHASRHTAYERFTRHGPLALLPLKQRRHVVVRCVAKQDATRLTECSEGQFTDELASGFGHRFGVFSELGMRRVHPLMLRYADRIIDERAVLVGAAATTVHPNGAQGLNLGLRDVADLADSIARAQAQNLDIGGRDMLREYARRRKPDQVAVRRFTHGLASVFCNSIFPVGVLRNAAMLAIDLAPPVKQHLIRRASGLFANARAPR